MHQRCSDVTLEHIQARGELCVRACVLEVWLVVGFNISPRAPILLSINSVPLFFFLITFLFFFFFTNRKPRDSVSLPKFLPALSKERKKENAMPCLLPCYARRPWERLICRLMTEAWSLCRSEISQSNSITRIRRCAFFSLSSLAQM